MTNVSITTRTTAEQCTMCDERPEYTVEQGGKMAELCMSHASDVKNGYEEL